MNWSRRTFLNLFPSLGGAYALRSASRRLANLIQPQSHTLEYPNVVDLPSSGDSSARKEGPTYPDLGYKVFIIDFQFSDLDPITLKNADAEKYADAMVEMGAETLLVYAITNTGFALFNSNFAPKFRNLSDNFLGDYLMACRKRKIKTVLYYSLCWQRTLDIDHPEWAVLDPNSKPVVYDTSGAGFMGRVNYLCLNSPFRWHALRQVKEIADRYTFDSWFIDILFWDRRLICYNPYCLSAWKARTGDDLPRPMPDAVYPRYLDFMVDTYQSVYSQIKDTLKANGKPVTTTHNYGFDYADDNYLMSESNPGGIDYYSTSVNCKLYRSHAMGRGLQITPHLNNVYLDYVNAPQPRINWQTADILTHNAAVMLGQQANIDGTLDASTIRIAKEAFGVADRIVPKMKGSVPYAEVGILASERDHLLTRGESYPDFYGANKLLTDLHWPFDVITEDRLRSPSILSHIRLLVIPNLQYISIVTKNTVMEFLESGGSIFFCGHCADFDHDGKPYSESHFGLVRIQETRASRGYVKPTFAIDDERLKATDVAVVDPDATHKVLATMIALSDTRKVGSPLKDVAYPTNATDLPVIVTGSRGKGQYTYAGYRFFKEYLQQNLPVIVRVFTRLVGSFYKPMVWVEAPNVVEAVFNRLGSDLRIALVNGITGRPSGGERHGHGYINIVEVIPIAGVRIVFRGKRVRRAQNLAGVDLNVTQRGGKAVVLVPHLEQYDVITVYLG